MACNEELDPIPRVPSIYLNKTTVLYGSTNSGKTTIIKDIISMLRDEVSITIVFSPTEYITDEYKNTVPDAVVHKEVDIKLLENIWSAQSTRSRKYHIANNMHTLRALFDKIATDDERKMAEEITHMNNNERGKKISDLFKKTIRSKKNELQNHDLEHNEIIAVKYLDFNPRMAIVFDDVQPQCKEDIIRQMFFSGRSNYMTRIFALQDDRGIHPTFRSHANVNIFTDAYTASIYFSITSNRYKALERKKILKIIKKVFSLKNGEELNYKKLAHIRDCGNKFYTLKVQCV